MRSIEIMTGESGPEVFMPEHQDLPPTEAPNQKVVDKGLHEKAAENAAKAAAEKQLDDPKMAKHLETVASELHEIAESGEKPLDHISKPDSYVAEAVHDTARLLGDSHSSERPITYSDFQREATNDNGYVSLKTLSPDHPKVQEKVRVLESVLGAGEKHEVPSEDSHVKVEESSTNVGVKLREVTDRREGKIKMSVVKARSRMQPPVIR